RGYMGRIGEGIFRRFPGLRRFKPLVWVVVIFEGLWTLWAYLIRPVLDNWSRWELLSTQSLVIRESLYLVVAGFLSWGTKAISAIFSPTGSIITVVLGCGFLFADSRKVNPAVSVQPVPSSSEVPAIVVPDSEGIQVFEAKPPRKWKTPDISQVLYVMDFL